jgi:hypothetical protein
MLFDPVLHCCLHAIVKGGVDVCDEKRMMVRSRQNIDLEIFLSAFGRGERSSLVQVGVSYIT